MKKLAVLLLSILAFGCTNDDENQEEPQNQWSITLNETIKTDAKQLGKTETLLFEEQRFIKRSVKQVYENTQIEHLSTVSYSGNNVQVTSGSNTAIYTLNADGYAQQCIYTSPDQERKYDFTYSPDGYLTTIEEYINNEGYSTTELTYMDGDLTSITSKVGIAENCTLYQPDEIANQYRLPCLHTLETHPFGFHIEALYAGLLGKTPVHFTKRTEPKIENNEEEKEHEAEYEEYTVYNYQLNKEGKLTEISSQTTYSGAKGDQYLYPNRRKISIQVK